MKTNLTEPVESAVAIFHTSQKTLQESQDLKSSKSERLHTLATTGDLNDESVIAEIGQLQIFAGLFPTRIPALEQTVLTREQELLRTTNEFILSHLGPRCRKLAARVREKVAADLRPLLSPGQSLDMAVSNSIPVQAVERLSLAAQEMPLGGPAAHASRVLAVWGELQALEESYS
jgi:hypothetical protein